MKSTVACIALLCALIPVARAQHLTVEQFKRDEPLQDSIVAAIVSDHSVMSKLISKVAENPHLHEMVIQHLTRLLNEKSGNGGGHDHASHDMKSHYVGDETREIKALSDTEIKALLDGEGMGMAMPAELNHYPGPRHVLDLGDRLQLSGDQKKSIQDSFDRMHAEATRLGTQLVDKERALDKAFASGTVGLTSLKQLTEEIEELRGQLRGVHLAAHINVRSTLTREQIESYDRLRGYSGKE